MSDIDLRAQLGEGFTDEQLNEMGQGMQDGSGIKLPFPHLVIWASNGDPKMKQLATSGTSPVSYFGGWNIDHEKVEHMAESGAMQVMPHHTGWTLVDKSNKENKEFKVFETRTLHLAPIAKRFSWLSKDGKSRLPEYRADHHRSHLQVLCLVGVFVIGDDGVTKELQYVAPAVVSVKGKGQSEAFKAAIVKWCQNIDAQRASMKAKGIPFFAWWQTYGTQGEAEFLKMGKGSETGTVTPVKAIMASDKLTADQMAKRFVGKDNFTLAAQLLKEAGPWLAAWKTPSVANKPIGGDQGDPDHSSRHDWAGNNSPPVETRSGGSDDGYMDIPFGFLIGTASMALAAVGMC